MKHYYISENIANVDGSHYAVGHNDTHVLLQLGDAKGEQVRVALTVEQVDQIIHMLRGHARTVVSNAAWDRFTESIRAQSDQ